MKKGGETGGFEPLCRIRAIQGSTEAHALIGIWANPAGYFDLFMYGYPSVAEGDRGFEADPDGDQKTNLAEYALGGAPDVSETYFEFGLQHKLVEEAGDWYAEFRYPRRKDAALRGLRYAFQVSEDLSPDSWMDRSYTVSGIAPIDETFEEVQLRINQPLSSSDPRLFGRVKIYLDE